MNTTIECLFKDHRWFGIVVRVNLPRGSRPYLGFECERCGQKAKHIKSFDGLTRFADNWSQKYG